MRIRSYAAGSGPLEFVVELDDDERWRLLENLCCGFVLSSVLCPKCGPATVRFHPCEGVSGGEISLGAVPANRGAVVLEGASDAESDC